MRVGEISRRTGVSVRSVRYYEQSGLLQATRRPNGYRDFDPSTIERVRAIRDLLDSGFTVEEVLSLSSCLQGDGASPTCCSQTATLYREKLARIGAQVRTLQDIGRRIEKRLATLEPCRRYAPA